MKHDLPPGVEVRGDTIRIHFSFHGKQRKEKLEGIPKVSKSAIKYAENKLAIIKMEIKEGKFDYLKHFPNSKQARLYMGLSGTDGDRTIEDGVKRWLEVVEETLAKSTFVNYRAKAQYVVDYFGGKRRLSTINKSDLLLFRTHLLKIPLVPKTVNEIFIVVRGVWNDAFEDEVIRTNPVDRISNLDVESDEEPDPYTKADLTVIEALLPTYRRPQDINMFLFTCWTGLSVSEIVALAWEDIDLHRMTIKVQRAHVKAQYKVPKEKSRVREIELMQPAIDILLRQRQHTFMLSPMNVEVTQRNNVTVKKESIRLVFINVAPESPTGAWHESTVKRWYYELLRKAGIRQRGPNQCRHTFASQMLTQGVPVAWIAEILGHTSEAMVRKHYGKIIPEDRPNRAKLISGIIGIDYKHELKKVK